MAIEDEKESLKVREANKLRRKYPGIILSREIDKVSETLVSLGSNSAEVRWSAVHNLLILPIASDYVENVLVLLQDESPMVRAEAVKFMGLKRLFDDLTSVFCKRIIDGLLASLADESALVRKAAAKSLSVPLSKGFGNFEQPLILAFEKEDNTLVKAQMAKTLGMTRKKIAFEALKREWDNPSEVVKFAVRSSIKLNKPASTY